MSFIATIDPNGLLRRNVDSRVRLELTSETNLEELEASLVLNTSVKEVDIFFGRSFGDRTQPEVLSILRSLSTRPNLKRLALTSEESSPYGLPTTALSEVLNLAAVVSSVELRHIALSADRAGDFISLQESFQNHASLTELHSTCWLSEETRLTMSLVPLIQAIAASRSLQTIYFHPAFVSGGLTSATAGTLCTSPILQSLDIGRCNLKDDNIAAMATALGQNEALQELQISCKIGEVGSLAIAHCLRTNTTLKVLCIHNTNTAISEETDDAYNVQISVALKTNPTLRHFALHGVKLSAKSQRAFATMIKDNCTLETVSLLELGDLQANIDMHTLLNRCGRRRLLRDEGVKKSDWIATMGLVSHDLDCLFYLLVTKPSLCDLSEEKGEPLKHSNAAPADVDLTVKRKREI